MTFGALIDDVRGRDQQLIVYRSGGPSELETWTRAHGITVTVRSLPPGSPDPFIEIVTGGDVVGTVSLDTVETLLEPPIQRPGDRDGISEGYRVLFDLLEKTVCSGLTRRELLAVSREIEDRAVRVGNGTLWVSFQTLATFESQTEVYQQLCTSTNLEVHLYGVDDWTPPAIPNLTYHTETATRFEPYWVLAFDGGTAETQACGLVAEEQPEGYTGFWTNNRGTVETIASAFESV